MAAMWQRMRLDCIDALLMGLMLIGWSFVAVSLLMRGLRAYGKPLASKASIAVAIASRFANSTCLMERFGSLNGDPSVRIITTKNSTLFARIHPSSPPKYELPIGHV
jgi:hypothetical protein